MGQCFEFDRGDVIEVYIKTIKALRLVDPRGLLLEGVPKPQATGRFGHPQGA